MSITAERKAEVIKSTAQIEGPPGRLKSGRHPDRADRQPHRAFQRPREGSHSRRGLLKDGRPTPPSADYAEIRDTKRYASLIERLGLRPLSIRPALGGAFRVALPGPRRIDRSARH